MPVAEVFLLKNACADAALLFLAARFHGVRAKGARIAAGAAFGALCALLSLAAGGAMLSLPAKAAVCAGMVFIATGKRKLPAVCASVWTGALLAGGANRMGLSWLTAGFVSGAALCALRIRRSAPAPGEAKLSLVHDGKETRVPAIYEQRLPRDRPRNASARDRRAGRSRAAARGGARNLGTDRRGQGAPCLR